MKFGLVHYNTPGNTLEEFLDYARETGFGGIELLIDDVWPEDGPDPERRAEAVRHQLESRGLFAASLMADGYAGEADFVVLEEEAVAAQVARMKRICVLATILGTQIVVFEGGSPKDSVPEERWGEAIAGCVTRCREFLEPMGVRLTLENHGWINKAELQLEILRRVNSPCFGFTLDTMNYRVFGHDLTTVDSYYEMLAPHVISTHLKDGHGVRENYVGTALGEGEIHLDHALACLKQSGYQGVWTVEYEGSDPVGGCRKSLEWLRQHVNGGGA
jgi:sugar phosphate isomerase/epimerase